MRPLRQVHSHEVKLPAVGQSHALVAIAAALVGIVALKQLGGFFAPLLFGAMVAAASVPVVRWLRARRVPLVISAAAVLLFDFAALGFLGWLFLTSAGDLQERLPVYAERVKALLSHATWRFGPTTASAANAASDALHGALEADRVNAWLTTMAERLIGITSFAAVVAFIVFFTLCEGEGLGQKLRALKPAVGARLDKLERVMSDVRSYLLVKSVTSMLAATATWVIVDAFDLPLAPLLALSMFLLHFVPNIGAGVGVAAAVAVALVERGTGAALAVGGSLGFVCLLIGSVLEPQFLGRALRLSPLVVLIGMLFWGWLWGPAGALLSVPLMVLAKAALENSEHAWVAQMLGNPPAAGQIATVAEKPLKAPVPLRVGTRDAA